MDKLYEIFLCVPFHFLVFLERLYTFINCWQIYQKIVDHIILQVMNF